MARKLSGILLIGHGLAHSYAAELAVERVKGVRAIANELTVKLPGIMERSDADIAHAAVNSLRSHTQVPYERIRVMVQQGRVTLEGEVDRNYEKQAAENAVRYLSGVKSLSNLLTLRPLTTPADLKERIRTSLKRLAEIDADQITVEASESRVTLAGRVRSIAERHDAERAVWNAPGVTNVDNQIHISPLVVAGV